MGPRDPSVELESDLSASTSPELAATASMCYYCFDVLVAALKSHSSDRHHNPLNASHLDTSTKPEFASQLPDDDVECPLFVTWDKKKHHHSNDFELRGCIGTLSPRPLVSSIGEYALISALRDKRFRPVSLSEVPQLRVSVSLLVQYEPCEHCHDWTVGIHGIIIRWTDDIRGSEYSATYLPEVASEQGWTQETTVESLIRKAGYHGTITSTLLRSIQTTRYQSSKVKRTFEEYAEEQGHDSSLVANTNGHGSPRTSSRQASSNCVVS